MGSDDPASSSEDGAASSPANEPEIVGALPPLRRKHSELSRVNFHAVRKADPVQLHAAVEIHKKQLRALGHGADSQTQSEGSTEGDSEFESRDENDSYASVDAVVRSDEGKLSRKGRQQHRKPRKSVANVSALVRIGSLAQYADGASADSLQIVDFEKRICSLGAAPSLDPLTAHLLSGILLSDVAKLFSMTSIPRCHSFALNERVTRVLRESEKTAFQRESPHARSSDSADGFAKIIADQLHFFFSDWSTATATIPDDTDRNSFEKRAIADRSWLQDPELVSAEAHPSSHPSIEAVSHVERDANISPPSTTRSRSGSDPQRPGLSSARASRQAQLHRTLTFRRGKPRSLASSADSSSLSSTQTDSTDREPSNARTAHIAVKRAMDLAPRGTDRSSLDQMHVDVLLKASPLSTLASDDAKIHPDKDEAAAILASEPPTLSRLRENALTEPHMSVQDVFGTDKIHDSCPRIAQSAFLALAPGLELRAPRSDMHTSDNCALPEELVFPRTPPRQIMLNISQVRFSCGAIEPLRGEVALFNLKHRTRVTESVYVDFNSSNHNECGGLHFLFTLHAPTSDTVLIMRIQKRFEGDLDEYIEPYVKGKGLKDKDRERFIAAAEAANTKLPWQTFAFTMLELFLDDASSTLAYGDNAQMQPIIRCKSDGLGDEHVFEALAPSARSDRQAMGSKRVRTLSGYVALNALREENLSESEIASNPFIHRVHELWQVEEVTHAVPPSVSPHCEFRHTLYIYIERVDLSSLKRKIGLNFRVRVQLLDSDAVTGSKLLGLPVFRSRNPPQLSFLTKEMTNFIAAEKAAGLNAGSRTTTEAICQPVQDDTTIDAELHEQATTSIVAKSREPHFHDELFVRLPLDLAESHHLLFTVEAIDVAGEKQSGFGTLRRNKQHESASANFVPVAFACMPVRDKMRLVQGTFDLPLATALLPGYLGGDSASQSERFLGEKAPLFRVRFVPQSTVFCESAPVQAFLKITSYGPNHSKIDRAVTHLLRSPSTSLVHFFPILMTRLLNLMCTQAKPEPVTLVTAIIQLSRIAGAKIAQGYLDYCLPADVVSPPGNRRTIFKGIVKQWLALLTIQPRREAADHSLEQAWFLFSLILKCLIRDHATSQAPREHRMSSKLKSNLQLLIDMLGRECLQCANSAVSVNTTTNYAEELKSRRDLARKAHAVVRSCSQFCLDLLSIADRSLVFELIVIFLDRVAHPQPPLALDANGTLAEAASGRDSLSREESDGAKVSALLAELRISFIRKICLECNSFVALNLPVADWKVAADIHPPNIPWLLSREYVTEHVIMGSLLETVRVLGFMHPDGVVRTRALCTLVDVCRQVDCDDRWKNAEVKSRIVDILFMPFMPWVLKRARAYTRSLQYLYERRTTGEGSAGDAFLFADAVEDEKSDSISASASVSEVGTGRHREKTDRSNAPEQENPQLYTDSQGSFRAELPEIRAAMFAFAWIVNNASVQCMSAWYNHAFVRPSSAFTSLDLGSSLEATVHLGDGSKFFTSVNLCIEVFRHRSSEEFTSLLGKLANDASTRRLAKAKTTLEERYNNEAAVNDYRTMIALRAAQNSKKSETMSKATRAVVQQQNSLRDMRRTKIALRWTVDPKSSNDGHALPQDPAVLQTLKAARQTPAIVEPALPRGLPPVGRKATRQQHTLTVSDAKEKTTTSRGHASLTDSVAASINHASRVSMWTNSGGQSLSFVATVESCLAEYIGYTTLRWFHQILRTCGFNPKIDRNTLIQGLFAIPAALLRQHTHELGLYKQIFTAIDDLASALPVEFFSSARPFVAIVCDAALYHAYFSDSATLRQLATDSIWSLLRRCYDLDASTLSGTTEAHEQALMFLVTSRVALAFSKLVAGQIRYELPNVPRLTAILLHLENNIAKSESSNTIPAGFAVASRELLRQLDEVLLSASKVSAHSDDAEMVADLFVSIADSYRDTAPDLRVAWLESLAQFQASKGNFAESGQAYVHVAAIVMEHLAATSPASCIPTDGACAIRKLCENAAKQEARGGKGSPEERFVRPLDATAFRFTQAGWEEILDSAASNLEQASQFDRACDVVEDFLVPAVRSRADFVRLARLHGMLQRVYGAAGRFNEKVMQMKESGVQESLQGTYFRVGFYGQKFFDELHGREFVYKEPGMTRIGTFTARIEASFASKVRENGIKLKIIQSSERVDANKLDPNLPHIQITTVQPVYDESNEENRLSRTVRAVKFSKVFADAGKNIDLLQNQQKRDVELRMAWSFPYLTRRLEVVDVVENILSPVEHAADTLDAKSTTLERELKSPTPNVKTLQLVLQGILLVSIHAGPKEVVDLFLKSRSEGEKNSNSAEEVEDGTGQYVYTDTEMKLVRKALRRLLNACREAVRVSGNEIEETQQNLQLEMEQGYFNLASYCEAAGVYVDFLSVW